MAKTQNEIVQRGQNVPVEQREGAAVQPQDLPRATPAVDIYENDDEFLVMCDVPGVERDDVDIRLDKGILSVSGRQRKQGENALSPVMFTRTFQVPDTVDANGITADLQQGVLRLHLKKGESAKSRRIQISAG